MDSSGTRRGCTEPTGRISRVTSSSLRLGVEGQGVPRWKGGAKAGDVGRRRAEGREDFWGETRSDLNERTATPAAACGRGPQAPGRGPALACGLLGAGPLSSRRAAGEGTKPHLCPQPPPAPASPPQLRLGAAGTRVSWGHRSPGPRRLGTAGVPDGFEAAKTAGDRPVQARDDGAWHHGAERPRDARDGSRRAGPRGQRREFQLGREGTWEGAAARSGAGTGNSGPNVALSGAAQKASGGDVHHVAGGRGLRLRGDAQTWGRQRGRSSQDGGRVRSLT